MEYLQANAAILLIFIVFEFSFTDRLIVTSSIFRKGEMDTLFLSKNIKQHKDIAYRSTPVIVGLIFSNFLLYLGASAFTATLASFPFLICYGALSFITYRKQLKKLQQGLPNAPDEE